MDQFLKLKLVENNHVVWVRKDNISYLHDDDTDVKTCVVLHFMGHNCPLRVKGSASGLRSLLECN